MAAAAIACLSGASEGALLCGSILFAGSAVLDRADGELARQTRQFTRFGHWLDLGADCTVDAFAMLALGLSARTGALGNWALCLGCSAAFSIGWLFWQLNSHQDSSVPTSSVRLVDPDDAILLLPVFIVVFGAGPTIAVAGIVTPVAALYAAYNGFKL